MVRYSDTHPSENAITITPHQVDIHPQEKCDRACKVIVRAVITVDQCQKVSRYADTQGVFLVVGVWAFPTGNVKDRQELLAYYD